MSEFDVLAAGASGMSRQRAVLDLAARNVAAAQAATPEHPYHRLIARFADPSVESAEHDSADGPLEIVDSGEPAEALTEMVAMLDAQRAYEADASVFEIGKRLAERTIEVGRL